MTIKIISISIFIISLSCKNEEMKKEAINTKELTDSNYDSYFEKALVELKENKFESCSKYILNGISIIETNEDTTAADIKLAIGKLKSFSQDLKFKKHNQKNELRELIADVAMASKKNNYLYLK